MTDNQMLKFISLGRKTPSKRKVGKRREDFAEIHRPYSPKTAATQAGRCSQCGVPFCQTGCPLHNNIPDWLMLAAEGRLREAYALSSATNTFPEICGRICPQDTLCEGACVIQQSGHGAVTIGAVEQHITDTAWKRGWVSPIRVERERSESVGIIGAGPAGLAAAAMLRERGYQVHIYDRHDRAGGLLVYGIPNFKLDKAVVAQRIRWLEEGGITFQLRTTVGETITFAKLREQHQAILIATGVCRPRQLDIPGSDLHNIVPAMTYLVASNRKGLGDMVPEFESGQLSAAGKHVVVIGGGDTAMDCVRTAVRQGAKTVKCLYRRDRDNMPGSRNEVIHAEEEGVEFVWLSLPQSFTGDKQGRVTKVHALSMRLSMPDNSGRRTPKPLPNPSVCHRADLVVMALGFEAEDLPTLWGEPQLPVTEWGTVVADTETGATRMDGVFAAGDIVRGASLVVHAIRDGRKVAMAIDRYIRGVVAPSVMAAE